LTLVRDRWAVVACVADQIYITILLKRVAHKWAIIRDIGQTILIAVLPCSKCESTEAVGLHAPLAAHGLAPEDRAAKGRA
jgi:hypothetical protein